VLDWDFHNVHTTSGSTSCKSANGQPGSQCSSAAACAQNCVVDGISDYSKYGVTTSGNAVTMYHYVQGRSVSPRIYLLDENTQEYVMFKLLNQELTVDVDFSQVPCGENGALYFSEMEADGGRSDTNKGGAAYGSGYCDAQCPSLPWRNGVPNTARQGFCCPEMDILEANARANAFTPHPCNGNNCDKSGCGYNPYSQGKRNFWGPGMTVDTSKPFTVVTQFQANGGSLSQITRKYIQNGRDIGGASGGGGDVITAGGCGSSGSFGGLAGMGQSLGRGTVLAMSIWNDNAQNMAWLDSGTNGPCQSGEGSPANIQSRTPNTHVVFSNIRWGDIGSTTKR
jgi:cellulase